MYVLAGRPVFARPYVGVHRKTSFMISSQQCPSCLVRLTLIVFVMWGRWCSNFRVGCWNFSLSIPSFRVELCYKDPFLIFCLDILEKQSISEPEKNTFHDGYEIFVYLLSTNMRSQTPWLPTLPIVLKWQQPADWDVLITSERITFQLFS